jgi:calcineurin-like phosphoesterase family protein
VIHFSADSHWNHTNIIQHSHRPFSSIEEMNEELITRWNSVVSLTDTVYHLGDILFRTKGKESGTKILNRLNGQIFLILGNHDKHNLKQFKDRFELWPTGRWDEQLRMIKIEDDDAPNGIREIVLCHYSMRVWQNSHHGSFMLHGHSHGSLEDLSNSLSFDVGVDCHNYYPISYEKVKEIMSKKIFVPIDHHTGDRE